VSRDQRAFTLLWKTSLAVVPATVLAFLLFGSLALMIGLATFVWLRLGVEIARCLLARRLRQKVGWCALLVAVHVVFASFVTYAFAPYVLGWHP
jgi:hypothetical protein